MLKKHGTECIQADATSQCEGETIAAQGNVDDRVAGSQGLLKKEGKQRFGAQYSEWQSSPASFEVSGRAPVRSAVPR